MQNDDIYKATKDLTDRVQYIFEEYDLTGAEMIGIIELVKFTIYEDYIKQ